MSAVVIRCPACRQLSRVGADAVGLTVACPRCRFEFTAQPDEAPPLADPPVVFRHRNPSPVFVPRSPSPFPLPPHADDPPVVHPHETGGAPFALAMVPLGIPLLWLILKLTTRDSVFTFAAPVAIAVGVCALGLGLASIRRWSPAVRLRALTALVALAYLSAGVFYFAQPEWLEGVRVLMTRTGQNWREYKPDDRTFRVRIPGDPVPTVSPLSGWPLTAVRIADPKNPVDVFVVAHGDSPDAGPARAGDEWFERVKGLLTGDSGATLVREERTTIGTAKARDYEFRMPGDRLAKRVVRVVQTGRKCYYLGVDGPSVTLDALDVQEFWGSFRLLTPARK